VEQILAENAGISYIGFPHIKGCSKLSKISLKNCGYIDDEALKLFTLRKETLKDVEIIDCKNITDEGLRSLKDLNLMSLTVKNLPYVNDVDGIKLELQSQMKDCKIEIEK
jgi:H+-transporting ATP synthase F0 complex subunit s